MLFICVAACGSSAMFVIARQSEYLLNTFVNLSLSISYWYPVPRYSNSAYIVYRF